MVRALENCQAFVVAYLSPLLFFWNLMQWTARPSFAKLCVWTLFTLRRPSLETLLGGFILIPEYRYGKQLRESGGLEPHQTGVCLRRRW